MAIDKLDHYSVRTALVARAVGFYEQALGLQSGPRPPFDFPGAWLYPCSEAGERLGSSVVHIVGIASGAGLGNYLGDKPLSAQAGSGALDHMAFTASGIAAMHERLAKHQIPFRERKVPAMELHQIFVEDPDGVTIELNYARAEDVAAGARNILLAASRP